MNGTPQNAGNHARQIKRAVDRCPHKAEDQNETYEFTIVASGLDPSADDFESRFYDAGCDDATVSFQKGHTLLDFASEADDVCDALASAVAAVRAVGATIDRIEPDPLVSLADIAARSGMTRAAMTQYSKGQRSAGFPSPVAKVTSVSPLWDWAEVSRWLFLANKVECDVVVQAEAVRVANETLTCGDDFTTRLRDRLRTVEGAFS